jgi:hypothetical protein
MLCHNAGMTIQEALTQYNANADYDADITKSRLALQALRVLNVNRAAASSMAGTNLNWASLENEMMALAKFVKSAMVTQSGSFTRLRQVR